ILTSHAIRVAILTLISPALYAQFGTGLYQSFEKAGCRACHNADGVASPTRLHFPEADSSAERVEAFGNSLVVLIDKANPNESLLLTKPTNRVKHAGGEKIKPGSPDEALLKSWIAQLSKLNGAALAKAMKYREEEGFASVTNAPRIDL